MHPRATPNRHARIQPCHATPCADADYFEQPGRLFRLMTPEQQEALFGNTARALGDAPTEIKLRHIRNCAKADPARGAGVARACGIPESDI